MLQFCLLAAAFLQLQTALQGQTANEPKPATVEGAVIHAASKVPIRKAKVTLQPIGPESPSSAETGDDGKFTVKDVKPGRYRIRAEKTGYETAAYGSSRVGDTIGQTLQVGAGAALTGIDITLPKQGAIAGKVIDKDGEPLNAALVLAMANVYYQNGRRARIPRGAVPVIANDLGEYRVGQLPPGKYIICAIPKAFYQPSPPAADKEGKSEISEADVTTCYPGMTQMAEASEIEIRDGTEIPSTDIRLVKLKTVTVRGRLTNVPASAGTVTLLNMNTKTSGPMGNAIHPRAMVQSADGKFEFRNVAPGNYVLHTLPTGLGNAPFVVKSELMVGDKPIQDLEIPVVVPFELKGKVQADPGPELKLPSIRVVLTGADDITPALAMASATADGDLTLANIVPGRYRVNVANVPNTHYIHSIRAGEQSSEGDEIDIAAGTPLTIVLTAAKSEIGGTVKNAKGEPMPGAQIALVPNPKRAFRLRLSRTDQNGAFRMEYVPPGDYRIAAFDTIDTGGLENEEFLKPFLSKMKAVKVEDSGSQTADLTLIPGVRD